MTKEDLIEKLRRLSPKERIEKLKEIQEKDKKEIEKAQELITESEDQAAQEEEIKKIPVPQLKSIDIGALFSSEEKELFKTKRFTSETTEEKEEEEKPEKEKGSQLEQELANVQTLPEEQERAHMDYVNQLSQKPASELKEKMANIYSAVKEKGYMSESQKENLYNVHYATQKKLQDIETGHYKEATKQAAQEMVLTEKMKNWLQDSYGRG